MAISKLQFNQLQEQGVQVNSQAVWDLALAHVARGAPLSAAMSTAVEELLQLQLDGSTLRIDLGEHKAELSGGSIVEQVLQLAVHLDLSQAPPQVQLKLEAVRKA